MIEYFLCLLVWNGTDTNYDCSFDVHIMSDEQYRILEHEYRFTGTAGITDVFKKEIYVSIDHMYKHDRYGMTIMEHEILHAQLYLNWEAAGYPGKCWCYFHERLPQIYGPYLPKA